MAALDRARARLDGQDRARAPFDGQDRASARYDEPGRALGRFDGQDREFARFDGWDRAFAGYGDRGLARFDGQGRARGRHGRTARTFAGRRVWLARGLTGSPLALAGLLAVAGCGGTSSGYAPPPGQAVASALSPEATESPSGGVSAPNSPEPTASAAPEPAFPKDFTVVYRTRTAPPKGARAVQAFGEFWKAWWYAVATEGRDRRYRAYIAPGSGPSGTAIFTGVVEEWARDHVRPVGVIRAYDVRVIAADDERVTLVGCGDESRAGTKDVTTGKVSWTFGRQKSSRYKIRIMMVPGPEGGWQIGAYQPVPVTIPAGRECR